MVHSCRADVRKPLTNCSFLMIPKRVSSGRYSITDSGCELAARMSLAKHDVSCSGLENDDCSSVQSQGPAHHTWTADGANDDCTLVQSPHSWGAGNAMSGCTVTEDLPLMERLGRKKFVHLYLCD